MCVDCGLTSGAVGFAVDLGGCCGTPVLFVDALVFGASWCVLKVWASGLAAYLQALPH